MDQPLDTKPNVEGIGFDHYPLDEQLNNACLLGREQLVPERLGGMKGIPDIGLGETLDLLSRRTPGGDDDLQLAEQLADLTNDRRLDLTGRNPPDRVMARVAGPNALIE